MLPPLPVLLLQAPAEDLDPKRSTHFVTSAMPAAAAAALLQLLAAVALRAD
jgi:hypothetical protein